MAGDEKKQPRYEADYSARSIGKRAQAYRKAAGLTAKQVAERAGGVFTENSIAKIENGHRTTISTDSLVVLARALGVPPALLLFPIERPDAFLSFGGQHVDSVERLGPWLLGDPAVSQGDPSFAVLPQWVAASFRELVSWQATLRSWSRLREEGNAEAEAKSQEATEEIAQARRKLAEFSQFLGLSDAD